MSIRNRSHLNVKIKEKSITISIQYQSINHIWMDNDKKNSISCISNFLNLQKSKKRPLSKRRETDTKIALIISMHVHVYIYIHIIDIVYQYFKCRNLICIFLNIYNTCICVYLFMHKYTQNTHTLCKQKLLF